jgi:hypothetical protein
MRFNARLDKSHHGPQHPFKDAGVAADSLTAIHNAKVKCLFVVNRGCIRKEFFVSRDSAVGTATGYGLNDRGVGVQVPLGSRIFSSLRRPDGLWGPPSLLSNG